MENEKINEVNMVKVSKDDLLSLIASKLEGRVLFPEKIERLKEFLQTAKLEIA